MDNKQLAEAIMKEAITHLNRAEELQYAAHLLYDPNAEETALAKRGKEQV